MAYLGRETWGGRSAGLKGLECFLLERACRLTVLLQKRKKTLRSLRAVPARKPSWGDVGLHWSEVQKGGMSSLVICKSELSIEVPLCELLRRKGRGQGAGGDVGSGLGPTRKSGRVLGSSITSTILIILLEALTRA